jgi:hypothetical protein
MAVRALPVLALAAVLGPPLAAPLAGQEAPPPGASPPAPAEVAAAPSPAAPDDAAEGGEAAPPPPPEKAGFLPTLEVYFPEGDLDLRASRLVNKVFFEGQVKYNFVHGDITAFLRYRYYGFSKTYQISGFDEVNFSGVERVSGEFDRTRGLLLLGQWPHDYHRRTFLLAEIDRLTSNKESQRFINNRTNTFVRAGFQIGTPEDERSNAIVGETRARVDRLFTAYRDIGPGDFGLTTALTYSFDFLNGDFDYLKAEFEGLKRFELGRDLVVVGRLHAGTFPYRVQVRHGEEIPESDRYSIPRNELFRLDGRDNLKGLTERTAGTDEVHTTWELFIPWFLGRDARAIGLNWQSWYWILYGGFGAAGFDRGVLGDLDRYYPDVGIGFETSLRLKNYRFFLAGVVAQALRGDGGPEARIAVKSYR